MKYYIWCIVVVVFASQLQSSMDPKYEKTRDKGPIIKTIVVGPQNVLNIAVFNNQPEYADKAIKAGASPVDAFPFCRSSSMLEYLFKKGLFVNAQQLLDWAVKNNHEGYANKALGAGASPYKALRYCHTSTMFTTLVAGGMFVDGFMPELGVTPLYFFLNPPSSMSQQEHYNILKIIFLMGADPDVLIPGTDAQNKPFAIAALHKAIMLKRTDLVKLLIEQHANLNIQDSHNQTPLHYAVLYELFDVMKLLVDAGAACDIQDKNHETPYKLALYKAMYDFVEYFDRAQYLRTQASSPQCYAITANNTLVQTNASINSYDIVPSCSTSSVSSSTTNSTSQKVCLIVPQSLSGESLQRPQEIIPVRHTEEISDRPHFWLKGPSTLWRMVVDPYADHTSQYQDHSPKKY